MRFERGKDIKETLNIGKKADARDIIGAAEISIEMETSPDMMTVRRNKSYNRVSGESHIYRVLLGVQNGHLNPEEHAVEILSVSAMRMAHTYGLPHFDNNRSEYIDMIDLLGEYVKYNDEYFRIPTMDEIVKLREEINKEGNDPFRIYL